MEIKELKSFIDSLNHRVTNLNYKINGIKETAKIDYIALNKRLNKLEKKKWYQFWI